jgi:hypothetical protein
LSPWTAAVTSRGADFRFAVDAGAAVMQKSEDRLQAVPQQGKSPSSQPAAHSRRSIAKLGIRMFTVHTRAFAARLRWIGATRIRNLQESLR